MSVWNFLGLLKVEKVVLIDIGQLNLVVWNLQRLIDSALFVQIHRKAHEGRACALKPGMLSELPEGIEGKHMFPSNIFMDREDEKVDEDLTNVFSESALSEILWRREPLEVIQDGAEQHLDILIGHRDPPRVIAG